MQTVARGRIQRVPNAISGTSGSSIGARRWYQSICRMRFPISVFYWSNTLPASFWDYCRWSAKLHIFPYPSGLPQ